MKDVITALFMIFALVAVYQPMYAQTEPVKVSSDKVEMEDNNIGSVANVTAPSYESSRSQALLRALSSAMACTDTSLVRIANEATKASCQEEYTIKVEIITVKNDDEYTTSVGCTAQRKSFHESVIIKK